MIPTDGWLDLIANRPIPAYLDPKEFITNNLMQVTRATNGRYFISGKDTDLSGFGADLSQWVKIGCRSNKDKIDVKRG